MKNSTRLLAAIALTLILAVGAVSVWAGAARQGTTPIFPEEFTGSCGEAINVGTGTVSGEGTCELTVKVNSEPGQAGGLPDGWTDLFDYVTVTATTGNADKVTVCTPLAPDWEGKEAGTSLSWFVWADGAWAQVETTITDGTPPLVCGTGPKLGVFTLLGK